MASCCQSATHARSDARALEPTSRSWVKQRGTVVRFRRKQFYSTRVVDLFAMAGAALLIVAAFEHATTPRSALLACGRQGKKRASRAGMVRGRSALRVRASGEVARFARTQTIGDNAS